MHSYLTNHGFRALVNAAIFNAIGSSLFNIVFIIYAGNLSFKTLAVSLVSFTNDIPSIIDVFSGYWADNVHHKYLGMIFSRISQFGLFVGLAGLIGLKRSLPIFIVLLTINMISDSLGLFADSLSLPLLRHLVANGELNNAIGLESGVTSTIQMAFQGVGATLIVWLNDNYSLFGFINAVTFLIAAVLVWQYRQTFMSIEPHLKVNQIAQKRKPMIASLLVTGKLIYSNKRLMAIVRFGFLINLYAAPADGLINLGILNNPVLWIGSFGNSVALVNILFSLGSILGAVYQNDFLARTRIMGLIILTNVAFVFLAVTFLTEISIVFIIMMALITGYLLGKLNPRTTALFVKVIPDDQLGAAMSFLGMLFMLGAPVGDVVFLTIANIGKQGTEYSWGLFAVCAGLTALAAILRHRFHVGSVDD